MSELKIIISPKKQKCAWFEWHQTEYNQGFGIGAEWSCPQHGLRKFPILTQNVIILICELYHISYINQYNFEAFSPNEKWCLGIKILKVLGKIMRGKCDMKTMHRMRKHDSALMDFWFLIMWWFGHFIKLWFIFLRFFSRPKNLLDPVTWQYHQTDGKWKNQKIY